VQKEREYGGKAAVWMNVERGVGSENLEGKKYGMRAWVLYWRKYWETNRGVKILRTVETCIV
jgi:hypothetical protein